MPQEANIQERVAALEALVDVLIKQMDCFNKIAEAVQKQGNLLMKLSTTQETCTREIAGLSSRLQLVEQRPLLFWDKVLFALIGAGVTSAVGVLISAACA